MRPAGPKLRESLRLNHCYKTEFEEKLLCQDGFGIVLISQEINLVEHYFSIIIMVTVKNPKIKYCDIHFSCDTSQVSIIKIFLSKYKNY